MVFSSPGLNFDPWLASFELIALVIQGFNPHILLMHSFPSVEYNGPFQWPVSPQTAVKYIWMREPYNWAKFLKAHYSYNSVEAARIHLMMFFIAGMQWFCIQPIRVHHKISLILCKSGLVSKSWVQLLPAANPTVLMQTLIRGCCWWHLRSINYF